MEPRFIASTRSAILAGLRLEWSRTKATPGRLAVAAQRRGMPLDFIPPAPITPLAGEFDQLVDRLLVTVFGPFSLIGQIGCSHHAQHLSNGFGPGRSARRFSGVPSVLTTLKTRPVAARLKSTATQSDWMARTSTPEPNFSVTVGPIYLDTARPLNTDAFYTCKRCCGLA